MKRIFLTLILLSSLLIPFTASAQLKTDNNALNQYQSKTLGDSYAVGTTPFWPYVQGIASKFVVVIIQVVGALLSVLIIYAGFLWATAGGNEDQVKKAKGYLKNGVIGLILILSAYILTSFVVRALGRATIDSEQSFLNGHVTNTSIS